MVTAEQLIRQLDLRRLPVEGGFYRETYRSPLELPAGSLGPGYGGARSAGTAIYYLLTPDTSSALHRLPGPEVYHFYLGDAVEMVQLEAGGAGGVVILGPDLAAGEKLAGGGAWGSGRGVVCARVVPLP